MNRLMTLTMISLATAPCLADGVYVGGIENGPASARVALVAAGNHFVCYACSDDERFNERYSRWMTGAVKKSGDATAASDGVYLHATVYGDVLRGGLQTADGESIEFQGSKIAEGSNAGLFRFVQLTDDDRVVDGWIVDEDGNIVGGRTNGRRAKGVAKSSTAGNKSPSCAKVAAGATGSLSNGAKKVARANTTGKPSVSKESSAKKSQQLLSSKKLSDRLPAVKKKADETKGTARKASGGKDVAAVSNKNSTSEKSPEPSAEKTAAKTDGKPSGKQTSTKLAEQGADAGTKSTNDAKKGGQNDKKVSTTKKKEDVNQQEAEEQIAKAGKEEGEQGAKKANKQGKNNEEDAAANAAEEVAIDAAEDAVAAAAQAKAAAKVAKQQLQQQQLAQLQQQANIGAQADAAAAEESPQPVKVENVRAANRNNKKGAAPAPAALPGEVVEGNLANVDDEGRVLTVDDGENEVEIPVGDRQVVVEDASGERAAETPGNAAAERALKGKPGQMLKKMAQNGGARVSVRIGAKNVVVKPQPVEAEADEQ